jgi:hypothetical protein
MRHTAFIIAVLLFASSAAAESSRPLKLDAPPPTADTAVPLKGKASSQSCAAYGPGFVKIAGTDTCTKVGGTISVDTTVRR